MVQQLFSEVERLKAEVRRLRGRLDRVSSGGTLILNTTGSYPTIPTAVQGALIVGNITPGWERLLKPTPASDQSYQLRLDFGDTAPSWKLAEGDDVFTVNMAAAL